MATTESSDAQALGYTVEASGFADELVRYDGATALCGVLTKAGAETRAKKYARQLMAEKREGGRVTVKQNGVVVLSLALRAGKWVA